jgi:hypothetical protein
MGWRTEALIALALAAVSAAVYAPAVGFAFVNFDDHVYVYNNADILGGLSLNGLIYALTTMHLAANWHPLTCLSLQLDATLWGNNPAGFHLTNLLLHAANTALVYLALRSLTGAVGRSIVVALLFGLHPLHVESVAWVSERKDVLSLFFGLPTLLCYRWYTAAPSFWRMLAVAGLLALGLAAKSMVVTLPCVLLLLDYWPLGRMRSWRRFERLVEEKTLLFLLVALSCWMTFVAQSYANTVRTLQPGGALVNYATYLGMTLWPVGLTAYYPLPADPRPWWQPAAAGALLVAVTGAAWLLRRRAPYLLVGWLWFLGTLVPVIGLVQMWEITGADRYTYLPHIGLFLAGVWGAADLAGLLRIPRPVLVGATGLVLLLCAALTRQQLAHWKDSPALCEHLIAVSSTARARAFGWVLLGKHYYDVGLRQTPLASGEAQLLAQIHGSQGLAPGAAPLGPVLQVVIASKAEEAQSFLLALRCFNEALRIAPSNWDAKGHQGKSLLKLGQFHKYGWFGPPESPEPLPP